MSCSMMVILHGRTGSCTARPSAVTRSSWLPTRKAPHGRPRALNEEYMTVAEAARLAGGHRLGRAGRTPNGLYRMLVCECCGGKILARTLDQRRPTATPAPCGILVS